MAANRVARLPPLANSSASEWDRASERCSRTTDWLTRALLMASATATKGTTCRSSTSGR